VSTLTKRAAEGRAGCCQDASVAVAKKAKGPIAERFCRGEGKRCPRCRQTFRGQCPPKCHRGRPQQVAPLPRDRQGLGSCPRVMPIARRHPWFIGKAGIEARPEARGVNRDWCGFACEGRLFLPLCLPPLRFTLVGTIGRPKFGFSKAHVPVSVCRRPLQLHPSRPVKP